MINKLIKRKKVIFENIALIFVAIIIGLIVSAVAQVFIIGAKNLFEQIFMNESFALYYTVAEINLNFLPLLICVPASILVGLLMYYSNLQRWHGPADTIFAAHNKAGTLDVKAGLTSTLASFISISGGASVGIYGPLVHFGATISAFLRRLRYMPKIQHDIIIGSGVAAAISAGFGAPIAGIIFAHETVLRHFSLRAITSIALSSMTANYAAIKIGIVTPPLLLEELAFQISDVIYGLLIIGLFSAVIAMSFMKSMIFCSTLPKKLKIKHWQAPVIAGLLCGLFGLFLDEVLGLGTQILLNIITEDFDLKFLMILLFCKLILTSCCIGFGFFGGTFSPALLLGAIVGAIIFKFHILGFETFHLSVLAVSGMAAVSSSVIGAPITAIILVLELTGSYEYAIAATIPIAICTFLTSRIFGNSFFDKQLLLRGIAISKGREQILLSESLIKNYVNNKFTKFSENNTISSSIKKLIQNKDTEGYIISKNNLFVGKIKLIDIINKQNGEIVKYKQKKPLILDSEISLFDTIKELSNFVGESVPVVNKSNNNFIGIISENDVLDAYLKISNEINHIEKD